MQLVKFLCSGAIGISVNLGILYLLANIFGMYYLGASVIAVSCSTVVGFLLQKFWTFGESTLSQAPRQFLQYGVLAIINIGINTGIVYTLKEFAGAHYLLAQFIGAGIVAVLSFLLYRFVVFAKAEPQERAPLI